MKLTHVFSAAVAAVTICASSAFAGEMMIEDAFARSATPTAKSGAAFFMLTNETDQDDRLIAASSDIANKVELHTHIAGDDGVMQMTEIEGGVPIAAGEMHAFQRGGDHVMFMGLSESLEQGAEITVTLTFEKAGDVVVQIPVDHDRKPMHGKMKH